VAGAHPGRPFDGAGKATSPRLRLAARDGMVYEGVGYEPAVLERLPWLAGVQLRHSATHGFEPIAEMEADRRLAAGRPGHGPGAVAGWQVVSLARFAIGPGDSWCARP